MLLSVDGTLNPRTSILPALNTSVLWLHDVRASDAPLAGGKAANLGELLGKGFPVPPGFVVSSAAYARFLEALELDGELRRLRDARLGEVERRCEEVRSRIDAGELPPELAEAILAAHARLLEGRTPSLLCAVRSSATAEDLGAASFAGQHGTYYYVDAPQLLYKVKQCWASLFCPEAVSYRDTHGIAHASVRMAVVVQEMIASEVSGVAFTANPVNGSRDELIIESSWGMGAALVDGRVTPDRYVVAREGLRLREQRIAEKRFMVRAQLEAGQQARLEEVPHDLRRRETLSPDLVRTVAEWSLKAEAHFARPQDVEWAIHDGRVYVLQSRPITVMGREQIGRGIPGKYVLFKPLVENFTDPLTPLTADLLMSLAAPGLRVVRGWLYMDVEAFCKLLPYDVSPEQLADHLYTFSKDAPRWRLAPAKLPVALLSGLLAYLVLAVLLVRTRRLPDAALHCYRTLCREVDDDPAVGALDALRRLALLPRLLDPIGNTVLFVNMMSLRFIFWIRGLRRLLARWAPELPADADVLLGSGSEGVLSAEMGRGIWALAQEAKRWPRVREVLESSSPERALETLAGEPEAREFLLRLDGFLAVNGHRAVKEFELRSPRWAEDPSTVLGMVRNYLVVESDPQAQQRKTAQARAELWLELRRKLGALPLEGLLGLRFRAIRHAAERVRYFLKLRENTRFYHIMCFGVMRKKVLRAEAELLRQGKLKCKDDVFFLRAAELDAMQADRLGWRDVEDRIRERRIEHIRLTKMGPPKTIGFELPSNEARAGAAGGGLLLPGQSASPGRYEGRARVILDPSVDARLLPGEVLVAPYTDPAWTPLFLTAGAAVVEIGSYLSHAGTVAREFGMPCVVDVALATQRIRSGDRVAVDGDQGTVRILSAGAETRS